MNSLPRWRVFCPQKPGSPVEPLTKEQEDPMSIVVSGASGDLGRRITALLLERVPARSLILLTRNPDGLKDLAAAGAQVRKADFDDPQGLQAAMRGGEVLMLISTLSIGRRP